MAGRRFLHHTGGRFTIVSAALLLLCLGHAYAEDATALLEANAGGMATATATGPGAGCCDSCGCNGACCPDCLGLCETITQSIFGQPDPNSWRPLPFSTLFSEGWRALGAVAQRFGRAPRQGLDQCRGRQHVPAGFFTFAQGFNKSPARATPTSGRTRYITPLSRRLMLITNVPFVLRNNAGGGLPTIEPDGQATGDDDGEPDGFRRCLVHAPRLAARDAGFLIHGRSRGGDADRRPAPGREDRRRRRPLRSGTTSPAVGWFAAGLVTLSRLTAQRGDAHQPTRHRADD